MKKHEYISDIPYMEQTRNIMFKNWLSEKIGDVRAIIVYKLPVDNEYRNSYHNAWMYDQKLTHVINTSEGSIVHKTYKTFTKEFIELIEKQTNLKLTENT